MGGFIISCFRYRKKVCRWRKHPLEAGSWTAAGDLIGAVTGTFGGMATKGIVNSQDTGATVEAAGRVAIMESFRFDYEYDYEIRHVCAKSTSYAYAILY